MADAGFFKGTSADQDSRFANKQKKLLKQMKFPDNIDVKIDMLKVNLDIMKPWITKRLQELLGVEDDVVIEFVFNQLDDKYPDPKMMQINLTGFLGGSKARLFIGELWKFLASAQSSPDGIPAELVEMKKRELLKRQEEDDRLREIRKREENSHRQDVKPDIQKLDKNANGRQSMPSRNENGSNAGYKSRTHYDDERRDSKSRRTDKIQSTSKSDEKAKFNPKSSSNRQRSPSKSPSRSRSPVKPSRKPQQRSSSSSSVASNVSKKQSEKTKTKPRSPRKKIIDLSDDHNEIKRRKKDETNDQDLAVKSQPKSFTPSPPREKQITTKDLVTKSMEKSKSKGSTIKESKKQHKRHSKRSRPSSTSHSSSTTSSDSESEKKKKQKKKTQSTRTDSSSRSRSPSPSRNRKSDKKKDNHKSRKHSTHNSKSASTKHHQSADHKRRSHRDRSNKTITKNSSRNESSSRKNKDKDQPREKNDPISHQTSSDNEIVKSSTPPKKPRLESQIKVQTPPPSSSSKLSKDNKSIKSNRTERIVVLEESRNDSIGAASTRISITSKTVSNDNLAKNDDENEIDLRERLLREKAIKSMKRRQLTNNPDDIQTKTTIGRIVYDLE